MQRSLAVCVILLTCFSLLKGNPYKDLFTYDAEKIRSAMSPLQQLEKQIEENENVFLPEYLVVFSDMAGPVNAGFFTKTPEDIPPFVWGCLLSGFGVALVYNANHDSEDTKKAFMGCIVNGIVLTGIYIINLLANY